MIQRHALVLLLLCVGSCRRESPTPAEAARVAALPDSGARVAGQDGGSYTHEISAFDVKECTDSTPAFTQDSVGPLSLDTSQDEIMRRCPTTPVEFYLDEGDEGPTPALGVRLGVARYLVLFDTASRVLAILTTAKEARVADGPHIGSPYHVLPSLHGAARFWTLGCGLQVAFERLPGFVFELNSSDGQLPSCAVPVDGQLPPDAQVYGIWLRRMAAGT